ncbi:MAG: glycoside hydrolase [Acidobacteriota bacterium]|nr:glycoside hydrolase [Acidobacteriota bacterium]
MNPTRNIIAFALLASALFTVSSRAEQPSERPSSDNQYSERFFQEMRWRMIGPYRGGRTRAAVGVPNQPNIFYIGVVNGGVWKSDDYGRTWNPIFDQQQTQSIGSIAIAASDPNTIYVGSGEGLHRPDLSVGDGIYKSTDGGTNWTHLGLRDGQQIPALAVDPRDPKRVFAAVLGHPYGPNEGRGLFRSTDGGQNWEKVLYKNENTGASDVEIDPSNPNTVYASLWEAREGPWEDNNVFNGTGGGLFKSTDGGTTWRTLQNGLPKNVTQINLTIAPSQPSRLYAVVGTNEKGEYGSNKGLGFYRSDDAGENWYAATTDPRPALRIGGGDLAMPKVDPKNPDVVYSASIVTVRSTDGGKTWTGIRGAPGGDDYQNLWINPENPNIILLVADQGAIVTVNGGQTWGSWFNQPTAQLYHVAVTNTFPYKVCGGQQESGSVCISSRGNDGRINFRDWHPVGVIEYGYVAPDPNDPDIIFGGGRNEVSKFHWSTGQVENISPIPVRGKYRADRTEPIVFSTVDPHTMYYAANLIFKTTDAGHSWETISPDLSRKQPEVPASVGQLKNPNVEQQRGAVYALAPSFKNVNTIWAGTDDGLIWITRDGGQKWDDITPPQLTAWSKVTQISASHFDDDTAYASVSRFRVHDLRPYIYRTRDGGKTWQLITAGLPDHAPVDTVREDPAEKNLIFAGTENGVSVSFDAGDHWQTLQLNLPHTSARDLWIHDDDLIVATHGRSFWILDDITPLRQLTRSLSVSSAFLYQPAVAYRARRDTNTDTPIPPDEPSGQNAPDGAILDYYLARPTSSPVVLEILNSQNQPVRRYSSADKPEVTQDALAKQLIPLYWIRPTKILPSDAGMHRWIWDLHLPPPTATKHEYPIAAVPDDTPRVPLGPLALPGKYTARLTVDGQSNSVPFEVRMDPRVKASPEALQQQFDQQVHLSEMLSHSSEAVLQARSVQSQLQKLSLQKNNSASLKATLEAAIHSINNLLEKAADANTPERALDPLNNDITTLYGILSAADAQPTKAVLQAIGAADSNLATDVKQWEQFKSMEMPDLNRRLRAAGLSEIQLNPGLLPDDGGMDINEE